MKNKLKSTLQKIFVLSTVVAVLFSIYIIPVSASILDTPSNTGNTYIIRPSQQFNYAYFVGTNGYNNREVSSISDAPSSMGTNDIENVAKPECYIPVTRIRCTSVRVVFSLTQFEEWAIADGSGFFRFRFGVYTRPGTKISAFMTCDDGINASKEIGEANGVYIGTGSSVRGVYNFIDMYVNVDNTATDYTLVIDIVPDSTVGSGVDILFTGTDPLSENSFISFTHFHASQETPGGVSPYPVGTVLRYQEYAGGMTYLYLDSEPQEIVNVFKINGITYDTSDYTSMFVVPDFNRMIASVYVPINLSFGYLYSANIIDEGLANEIGAFRDNPYYLYQNGYRAGLNAMKNQIDNLNNEWQERYDLLVESKGNAQKQWYQQGYNDGYWTNENNNQNFRNTLDGFANLLRVGIKGTSGISLFGVSIGTIVIGTVSIVCTIFILKRFKS